MATPTPLLCFSSSLLAKKFSYSSSPALPLPPKTPQLRFKIQANLGGSGEADAKKAAKKKFITKEEEPQQYWQTAGEREGENPMKTPLPYIIIFGMSTPFIILAVAFANGWIKIPVR
uniref:Transmembrane protein n=1 Tax=Kalanchoe fedtschenkoi TaxID=63787 RepID=A0A7N0VMQ7_KALFE